jgi:hypothetical protein
MDDFDTIPVRLPSGTKAVVLLPRPFTPEDAEHMLKFLALYIEEADPSPLSKQEEANG